eukprot:5555418-Pyramimonas_sp.AAC.1
MVCWTLGRSPIYMRCSCNSAMLECCFIPRPDLPFSDLVRERCPAVLWAARFYVSASYAAA